MTNNQNEPRKFDIVLGGEKPLPLQGAVLGGLEGVKQRLASSVVEARVAALNEALNYGEIGLDLVINSLEDKHRKVRQAAAKLLENRTEKRVKLTVKNYKFWSSYERLDSNPYGYAKTFANRKVIEFDTKIGISVTDGAAYALRVNRKWVIKGYEYQYDMSIPEKLQILIQHPLANQLEALVIGFWYSDAPSYYNGLPNVVDALIDAHEFLTNIKALFIGDIEDPECMISSIVQSNLSLILVAYPNLEVLKVRGDGGKIISYSGREGLVFEPQRHDNLKALIIESGGLRCEAVNQICKLELPALEYLELWLGRDEYGGTSSIDDIMPILSGVFPKLKYLGLRNSEYTDDIAFAIVKSPIIEQIVELDLSMGNLRDEAAEALLNCPAVHQLDTLNLSHNCLTRNLTSQLMELDMEVIIRSQKGLHNRYCTVAE